jgi:hypothetical protein
LLLLLLVVGFGRPRRPSSPPKNTRHLGAGASFARHRALGLCRDGAFELVEPAAITRRPNRLERVAVDGAGGCHFDVCLLRFLGAKKGIRRNLKRAARIRGKPSDPKRAFPSLAVSRVMTTTARCMAKNKRLIK